MAIPFTVATWNVNSVRSRLEHVLRYLEEATPDVLCLQELKTDDNALPREAFEEMGYHIEAYGQKTYNGVAIVSPFPITDVSRGFSDGPEDEQKRLIAATVCGIRVVNVYVPNGSEVGSDKYVYKLNWMARLAGEFADHHDPKVPTLLCGDFNVAPDDRDVYDPKGWAGKVLCSDPERAGIQGWLEWGLTDAFRRHHDEAGLYSWWDYRMGAFQRDRGLRIDHIWVTEALAKRCTGCVIDREPRGWDKPSDHTPVVATFSGVD